MLSLSVALILAQSRECKKRLILILEAIAAQSRVNDRAIDAIMQFVVARGVHTYTLRDFQREAMHETTTQAQYSRTFFRLFAGCEVSEQNQRLTFDPSRDTIYTRLRAIYEPKPEATTVSE